MATGSFGRMLRMPCFSAIRGLSALHVGHATIVNENRLPTANDRFVRIAAGQMGQ